MAEAKLIEVRATGSQPENDAGVGAGVPTGDTRERGYSVVAGGENGEPPVLPDPSPPPQSQAQHATFLTAPVRGEDIAAALQAPSLAAHSSLVRWLKVNLDEVTEKPGFWIMVRCSMSDVVRRSINFEKPPTFSWIFGEHNLTFDEDRPALYDMVERDAEGEPLLLSPAHAAGDPFPPGGSLQFAAELPMHLAIHCFGQAYAATLRGGRTEPEKKP